MFPKRDSNNTSLGQRKTMAVTLHSRSGNITLPKGVNIHNSIMRTRRSHVSKKQQHLLGTMAVTLHRRSGIITLRSGILDRRRERALVGPD